MTASVQFDIIGNDKASSAFDSSAASADRASSKFSAAADESASKLDRVAGAADNTASATAQAAGGIGDLAGGLAATGLISEGTAAAMETGAMAIMGLTGAADIANLVTEKFKLNLIGQKVAMFASNVATKAAAAGQWLWNAAMSANPIGIVVLAIAALVAGAVWFFTQTEVGRAIVAKAWSGIQAAIGAVTTWWQTKAWPTIQVTWLLIQAAFSNARAHIGDVMGKVLGVIKSVWNYSPLGLVVNNWGSIMDWLKAAPGKIAGFFTSLPGRIAGSLSNLFAPLGSGFRSTVNGIIAGWNNLSFTVGGGSFAGIDIPSATISTPNIPYLARGGDILRGGAAVVGDAGPELLQLPTGARVTPLSGGRSQPAEQVVRLEFDGGDSEVGRFLVGFLKKHVRVQGGGNVQRAFG
ncbi:hypothetical protein [Promicromonospora sp. NPDC023805]|uniref:hypothetical protein n=1 Tax=Promicromonospora sp. NPDC023805 TaxID=3154696 RepID=UPI0033F51C27